MILALMLAAASSVGTPVTACRVLKTPGETFVLQNDVASPGTCFSIQADNITLNLNGHTITYGTAATDKKVPTFGVLSADCWFQPIAGNPCGGSRRNAVVENGKIVQGADAPPFSHAIRFGQGNEQDHIVVHDLDITVSTPDSVAIYAEYLTGGSNIYRNTIHNNVTHITSRSQFRGASIKLESEENAKIPNHIHDNTIIGGAQLGIREVNPAGSLIYNNDISQDATYTNGFCIDAAGANIQVYRNNCHPAHGRGIHVNHNGISVHDNKVDTTDSDKNEEYGGCEINGTYGIQVETDYEKPTGIHIVHNDVTVHAAGCPAEAMRLTDMSEGETLDIHDNTFRAVRDMTPSGLSTKPARAFSIGESTGEHVNFTDNRLIADSAMIHVDWDVGSHFTLKHTEFTAGPHPEKDLVLISFLNGTAPSQGIVIEDSTFNGFSPTAVHFGDYAGASSYVIAHSRLLSLLDGTGKPLQGLQVSAIGSAKTQVFQGATDHDGKISVIVPVLTVTNDKGKPVITENSAVNVSFDKGACPAQTLHVSDTPASEAMHPIVCN